MRLQQPAGHDNSCESSFSQSFNPLSESRNSTQWHLDFQSVIYEQHGSLDLFSTTNALPELREQVRHSIPHLFPTLCPAPCSASSARAPTFFRSLPYSITDRPTSQISCICALAEKLSPLPRTCNSWKLLSTMPIINAPADGGPIPNPSAALLWSPSLKL